MNEGLIHIKGDKLGDTCEHKWVFKTSDFSNHKQGHMSDKLQQFDNYYCEKCLAQKTVKFQETTRMRGEPFPHWYKGSHEYTRI